jgi:hypothetical protein
MVKQATRKVKAMRGELKQGQRVRGSSSSSSSSSNSSNISPGGQHLLKTSVVTTVSGASGRPVAGVSTPVAVESFQAFLLFIRYFPPLQPYNTTCLDGVPCLWAG